MSGFDASRDRGRTAGLPGEAVDFDRSADPTPRRPIGGTRPPAETASPDGSGVPGATLTLTLEGPARLMGAAVSRSLRDGSLLVGRSPVCGWVLPDPERVVSGRHCRIDAEIGRFTLTDLSTNGVFVDDAADPLGPGGSVALRDGQRLRLGDVRIRVSLEGRESAPMPFKRPVDGAPAGIVADDWFAPEPQGSAGASAPAPIPEMDDVVRALGFEPTPSPERADASGDPDLHAWAGLRGEHILEAFEAASARFEPSLAQAFRREFADALAKRAGEGTRHG